MKKALFGCGGHAREIMAQMRMKLDCFVDDQYAVHGMKSIKDFNPEEYEIMISVADPESREKIAKKLPKNTKFFSFVHPTVLMMSDNIEIGEGGFIGAYSLAAMCGCKAIILEPNSNVSYDEGLPFMCEKKQTPAEFRSQNTLNLFGVAFGVEDVEWANQTVHFAHNHVKSLSETSESLLDEFVNYWETKLL